MSDVTVCLIADPAAPPGAPVVLSDAPATDPHVRATDLGVNRGDGIFEVAGCLDGRIQALQPHLRRFARSASMLDLPAPNLDHYAAAAHHCVDALTRLHPGAELLCKLVFTRGAEMGEATGPAGWAMAYPAPDFSGERTRGIRVVRLDRGVPARVGESAPWLLAGAKTLSYAVNKAALREAKRRGADDVLFVSSDGHALEGPSSSLIALLDGVLVTPDPDEGILAGTTQADVFEWAARHGLATQVRAVVASELDAADALWLTSSGRLAAPISSLDGRPVPVDAVMTAQMNDFLRSRG